MEDAEDPLGCPPKLANPFSRSKKFALHPPHHPRLLPSHYHRQDFLDDQSNSDFIENGINYHDPTVYSHNLAQNNDDVGFESCPKRQKLKDSTRSNDINNSNNYECAPRSLGNSSREDWSEHEKFVLLEVWGDRFLQSGRNSLRSEEWAEVAEKVSEAVKTNRSEAQCRQMMDVLKRRYRKEKAKGSGGNGGNYKGKWGYFKKMDMLMKQECGGGRGGRLACGVDSGEFVFMDTHVYLECANGNDEMRDSPCESEEEGDGGYGEGVSGLRVLADSVQKFGQIYEKIESSKREQMAALEKMRVEFQRELELQKKQILDGAQAEIAKIREEEFRW